MVLLAGTPRTGSAYFPGRGFTPIGTSRAALSAGGRPAAFFSPIGGCRGFFLRAFIGWAGGLAARGAGIVGDGQNAISFEKRLGWRQMRNWLKMKGGLPRDS